MDYDAPLGKNKNTGEKFHRNRCLQMGLLRCPPLSNYIIGPQSACYEDNKEIVEKELDYLEQTLPENGVWGITWTWFDNNENMRKEFAISENWWKAAAAVDKLVLLKNFGRLETGQGR